SLAFVSEFIPLKPQKGIRRASHNYEIIIPLVGVIDIGKERAQIEKKISTLKALLRKTKKNLSNKEFMRKADPQVVEDTKRKGKEIEKKLTILSDDLKKINDCYN
ncbi:MAG: hypothetical protein U9R01_08450, partial [candidate division WOR-3 bacterium]|nr:hypothetical protein [candidate division WOR-3 bacterium]